MEEGFNEDGDLLSRLDDVLLNADVITQEEREEIMDAIGRFLDKEETDEQDF